MQLSDVVRRRRMVRSYDPGRTVDQQTLVRLLDLATRAPSAGSTQGWDFLVLREAHQRTRFWHVTTDPLQQPDTWLRGMQTAPILVLCLADPDAYRRRYAEPDKRRRLGVGAFDLGDHSRGPIPYWDVDTGMAALLLLLGAVDAGLGGCFFGVPPDRHAAVLAAFDVPPGRRPVGVVSLGYPAPATAAGTRSPSRRRARRPVVDVAHDGRFGVPFAAAADGAPPPDGD